MLGAFSDQARNLILLAEDEARMLGRATVEPEHLLLALTRHGNVQSLLRGQGVSGSDLYGTIINSSGLGDELVLGTVPRSPATDRVLEEAVDAAAERGVLGASSEHLLLALSTEPDGRASALLQKVGISDARALVDGMAGRRRPPVSDKQLKRWLLRSGSRSRPPRPGPGPPVFERYTQQAQQAVRAAVEIASMLEHHDVQPLHLLLGCMHVPGSLAAQALGAELAPSDMGRREQAMMSALIYGPAPAHQATGTFNKAARHVLAEGALTYSYRHDDQSIGTGHLLLATLDTEDPTIDPVLEAKSMGSGPVHERLARTLIRQLPGSEDGTGRVGGGGVIAFDRLIGILTRWLAEQLPPGWNIHGAGRSRGFRLTGPDSHPEEGTRIDLDWILTSMCPGRERLLHVTRATLKSVQTAVTAGTSSNWPSNTPGEALPEPRVEITSDTINPDLQISYGPSREATNEHSRGIPLNSVLDG